MMIKFCKNNYKFNIFAKIGKRVGAFLLALAIVCSVFSLYSLTDSYASDDSEDSAALSSSGSAGVKTPSNKAFLLKITTGSVTTDQIQYFCIKYTDNTGTVRCHYLYPDRTNYLAGLSRVCGYVSANSVKSKLSFLTNDTGSFDSGFGIGFDSYESEAEPLKALSTTYFYFETNYQFVSLLGISFFGRYKENGSNEISLQDVSLYLVDTLYDVDFCGNFSNDYYIDFSGKSLMKTTFERTLSWSQSDTLFDFGSLLYADNKPVDMGRQYYSAEYYTASSVKSLRENDNSVTLTFKIDISDVYGGGAEFLNSSVRTDGKHDTFFSGWFREALVLDIQYTDDSGIIRSVDVPVLLSSLYKAINGDGDVTAKSVVSGLMQQGESLVFDVLMPNTSDPSSAVFTLKYGRELAKETLGFSFGKGSQKLASTEPDRLNIDGVTVYNTSEVSYSASVSNGFIKPEISGTPILYYTSYGDSGLEIGEGTTFEIPFSTYSGTEVISKSSAKNRFAITLKTDTPVAAATTDGISVVIHYKSVSGDEKDTDIISVKDSVNEYYGYWPTGSGKAADFGYATGTASGGELTFITTIYDIDTFLGMTFTLDQGATDDWQCAAIKIVELKSIGKREATWESVNVNGVFSDRSFTRTNQGTNISPTLNGAFLVTAGESTYVEFESGGASIDDNDINWNDYKYEMSYSDTLQNLGFTKSRATYNVEVEVAGDIVNGTVNEDCGSKNQFYFKLVFENGSSAYVLANQQLTSDGFTSGVTHVFTITTNNDMGNLTAIKILPDNQNEDTDVFDKLKINKIVVTKQGTQGLCLSWQIDINDWITIDYQDTGAKDSARGQTGKTENELAETYRVTSTGYSLNLMVAIETIEYVDKPFEGRISAEIDYINSSNYLVTKKIDDVTALIYDYIGFGSETTTYTPVNGNASFEATAIDRSLVYAANHTDRFFISLTDVTQIVRIKLTVKSTTAGRWKIGGVSVYRVISKGNKILNDNNEYQYSGEVELICQSNKDTPYDTQYIASGVAVPCTITFGDNKIDVDLSSSWISSVSYVPQSDDDTINIYAYMTSKAKNIGSYKLKAETVYSLSDQSTRRTVAVLSPDTSKNMFYAKDIKVSGLRQLVKMGLKVDSLDSQYAPCDYVIVEHLRSGVVINTYFLDFNGYSTDTSSMYFYVSPGTDDVNVKERQILTFMATGDSVGSKISADLSDLAICINYTSANDPTGAVLTSPNLFLSDLGISSIGPGDVISITFDQKYVKDITGITFVATGSVSGSIKVKAARVTKEYENDSGEYDISDVYCFGSEMVDYITYSPRYMTVTATTSGGISIPAGTKKSVGLLTLTFNTKEGSTALASSASVRLKIGYYDDYNVTKELNISDISNYIVSGGTGSGESMTVKLLVSGISSLRFIEIEPYANGTGTADWTLESVSALLSVSDSGVAIERLLNKTISEDSPETIGFGNVKIQVVSYVSKTGSDSKERRGYSSASDVSEGILLELGNIIEFVPTVEGSVSDITVKCNSIAVTADGKTVTGDVTNSVLTIDYKDGAVSGFEFNPVQAGDYRIIVSSNEISSVRVEISISVVSGS